MNRPNLAALAEQTGLGAAQIHVRALGRQVVRAGGKADDSETLAPTLAWAADDGRPVYPASMIKVPLAAVVMLRVEQGVLDSATRVEIDERNMTVNDAPSPMAPGYRATVEELQTLMLQRSDNVATNQLYEVLGRERATAEIKALGFPGTAFRRKLSGSLPLIDDAEATGLNTFPAAEAAALFQAIAEDRVPGAAVLRGILATSWWDVKLSRGLESGDRFAHKTGDTDEVSHDGGILTLDDGSRWVVVVYTELPSSEENDLRFGAFMRALRPHLRAAVQGDAAPRRANGV